MTKILFVSDVHIGIRYPYRVNLRTGISDRTLDFINALARVVKFAIKEQIDIFVISGDLYDRVTIGPTLLRQVREKIWQPLIKYQIPIILVGGNHDSPQIIEKGSPFGEVSIIPNSIAARAPQSFKVKGFHSGEEIGFILLPYMTATQTSTHVEEIMGKEIEREQQMVRSQELLQDWIQNEVTRLDTNVKIIVGHFFVKGSKIGIIPYPDQLPHEFIFKRDMLPLDQIDLAVFGHIHMTQRLFDGKVLIPGSLERVDFGETKDEKGFYIYETNNKDLKFISNNPRPLTRKYIEVPPETTNPTEFIISRFPKEITEAIVRIDVKISSILKKQVIIRKIHEILDAKAFHYEINWDTSELDREFVLPKFTLDPLVLFSDYISEKHKDYPHLEELRKKGLEILNNAFSRVEEAK
ncbi:MAG: metallophosphoesterase family protein [Candidatus Hodarchaeales archaeon]|jgi:exonuclease SbcD